MIITESDQSILAVQRYFYPDVKQAGDEIEKLTGIKRSNTQVRQFLYGLGCRPRKIGMIPAKADTKQQEEFLEKELNPILDVEIPEI